MSIASASVSIKFVDNCDCDCGCWPWKKKDDPQMYITKDGFAEKFDQAKAMGNENRQSIERLEVILEDRLRRHSDETAILKAKIQELAQLNFELMKKKDVKVTRSRLERINDAIKQIFET